MASRSHRGASPPEAGSDDRSTRALARILTRLENGEGRAVLEQTPLADRAQVIGVTGPPGSGKSTLVDRLIDQVRSSDRKIAVLAVDPSSPFTGGAILGDRVRMNRHASDAGVFIRSMAARAAAGGLSVATGGAVRVLDGWGYEVIVLETVGVGQNELAVMPAADTVLVLVAPGLGDSVQMLKAGVLEIADILVVNMADRQGASRTVAELRAMLSMGRRADEWDVPVLETVATEGRGLDELWQAIDAHHRYLVDSGELEVRRRRRAESELFEVLQRRVQDDLLAEINADERLRGLLESARARRLDPHNAADKILSIWRPAGMAKETTCDPD